MCSSRVSIFEFRTEVSRSVRLARFRLSLRLHITTLFEELREHNVALEVVTAQGLGPLDHGRRESVDGTPVTLDTEEPRLRWTGPTRFRFAPGRGRSSAVITGAARPRVDAKPARV